MKKKVTKKEFEIAEKKMNNILAIATHKKGFQSLSKKESAELEKYTEVVKTYENAEY